MKIGLSFTLILTWLLLTSSSTKAKNALEEVSELHEKQIHFTKSSSK